LSEFATLAQEVAASRELQFKREIALGSFAPGLGQSDAYGPFRLQDVERAYQSIGLWPNDFDLGKALSEFRRLEQVVAYDATRASVAFAPNAAILGAPFEMNDPALAREAPLLFAIVAALLEQNFQWQAKLNSLFFEDHRLAFRALTGGDAVLTLIARASAKNKGNFLASDLAIVGKIAAELEKAAARLPDFLRYKLIFPYRHGSQFVSWALNAKGWQGVNALYAQPPRSTAEFLHPEKYFRGREAPLRFFPAALLRRYKESPAVEQSVGEHLTRGLLASELPAKQASATAAAWRGDQLFAFHDSGNLATAWFSSWKSDTDAAEFQRGYRTVLEKRQRLRFDLAFSRRTNALVGTSRDGRGVWLQANGPVVLLVNGVPAIRLSEFAEEAWRDLEIEADSTAIRFDSVKRVNQLSLKSK